jgi:hypothetical protein
MKPLIRHHGHVLAPDTQSPLPEPVRGNIRRRLILGGLINQYEPAA